MKKLVLTIAILLGMSFGAFAQYGGGLFRYGFVSDEEYYGSAWYAIDENNVRDGSFLMPGLPTHNFDTNQNAPLGGGTLLLLGFGAAYALKKRSKK